MSAETIHGAATVWLTGLPSAGKSTIAQETADRLRAEGRLVHVLDGDEVRAELTPNLGFSAEDRHENVRRIGYVARLLAEHGVIVLVAAIAPYAKSRDAVATAHAEHGVCYLEVHVDTPVEVCARRDAKGLYRQHAAGLLTGLTGIDGAYEIPRKPHLRIDAHNWPIARCVESVRGLLVDRGLI